MAVDDPENLHRSFAELVNMKDLDGLLCLYEPRATLVGPNGQRATGSAAMRAQLQMLLAGEPKITPLSSRALVVGDIALMSNRWRMTFDASEGPDAGVEGTSAEVARRQDDGSWRYVIDDPASAAIAEKARLVPGERAGAGETPMQALELPYIDEHSKTIKAEPEEVWQALLEVVDRSFGGALAAGITRILGCEDCGSSGPRPLGVGSTLPGFHVSSAMAQSELALQGRHRFSRYALTFRVAPIGGGRSRLTAETRAEFPGAAGRLYRALVIGTRGHVAVVAMMLLAVGHRARRPPRVSP